MISKEKMEIPMIPVGWENHFQSGFISEFRDGNHLLFMSMKQGIYSKSWSDKRW